MKVITLAKTKELLGIADATSDTDISAKIPYIDSLVKQITNNRFNFMVLGDTTIDSPYVPVYSIITQTGDRYDYDRQYRRYFYSGINNPYSFDDIGSYLEIGQQIEAEGIPAETWIDEVYYNGDLTTDSSITYDVPCIKLSQNATETTAGLRIYIGMNIAYQATVAKGIQYLINGSTTAIPTNSLASRSIGPTSKSFSSSDQKIDNRYGMPAWFIKAFPKYHRGH